LEKEIRPQALEKDKTPTLLFTRTAEKMYVQPEKASELADTLYTGLAEHYRATGMSESDRRPHKAEYLKLRGPWNALIAPILHGIEIELLKQTLPVIQANERLAPPALIENSDYDPLFGGPYNGVALFTIRAMTQRSVAAAEHFFEDINQDPEHWCHPILEAFSEYHPLFRKAEARQKNGWQRQQDPIEAIIEDIVDANETAYAVIQPLIEHYMEHVPNWHTDNQKAWLLARNEEMGWSASTTRTFAADYLPRDWQSPRKAMPYAPPGHAGLWALRSFKAGAWSPPRYCPANILLGSPFEEGRALVQLATRSCEYQEPRQAGVASVAELRLNTLTHVVDELSAAA
jgi:hypothetical protein